MRTSQNIGYSTASSSIFNMSGELLLAAIMAEEDLFTDGEEAAALADGSLNGKDEEGVAEAISHKPTSGQQKKRKSPAVAISHKKKPNLENRNLKPVTRADGLIQSIFVEDVCIPMWPQYVDEAATCNFIRIGTQEDWVNQFMVASRKAVKQGNEKDGCTKDRKNGRSISSNAYVTKFTRNLRKRCSKLDLRKRESIEWELAMVP